MPVKHAVLGLLLERRGYGHDLMARLEARLGPGFEIPAGTFYAALNTLEKDGHAREARRAVVGNRERVYYEPTPEGVEHFQQWLEEPLTQEPLRGEVYLKLALVDRSRIWALRERFEALDRALLSKIAHAASAPELAEEAADPVAPEAVVRWLLDSRTLDHLNGERAFVRRTLSVLDWLEADGAVPRRKLLEAVSSSG